MRGIIAEGEALDTVAVRVSASGLLKALETWNSDNDRARALAVAAKAALWMCERQGVADAFRGLDVQHQLLPPSVGVAASSDAEAHCSHWAFSLLTAFALEPAKSAAPTQAPKSTRMSPGGLSAFNKESTGLRSDLSAIRAEAQRKDKELGETLEDAEHVAELVESVASLWNYDKIIGVLKALLKIVRRAQARWPAYAAKLEAISARVRAMLGLLSELEVEARVRLMILGGTRPPAPMARRVKRLYFMTRENGDDIADALDDLSLVQHCKNLEEIGLAGSSITTIAPLLSCKKLRFIDAESSSVISFREISRESLPNLQELLWGDTPAYASGTGPVDNHAITSAKANNQRRIIKATKTPAR